MALLARERFGVGQDVEVSQMGGQLLLQHMALVRYLATGHDYGTPRREDAWNPLFSIYRCADDTWTRAAP